MVYHNILTLIVVDIDCTFDHFLYHFTKMMDFYKEKNYTHINYNLKYIMF